MSEDKKIEEQNLELLMKVRDGKTTFTKEEVEEITGKFGKLNPLIALRYRKSFVQGLDELGYRILIKDEKIVLQRIDGKKIEATESPVETKATVKAEKPKEEESGVSEDGKPHDDYYLWPANYDLVEKSLLLGENILLVGPAGCGKSILGKKLAEKHKLAYHRYNLHGDLGKEDFLGTWKLVDGETVFVDGILPSAMKQPNSLLLLDELDMAHPEILTILQRVLETENGKCGALYNSMTHELVVPAENFHIMATANTTGRGDTTSLYQGTNPLNEAFLDRFATVLKYDYPDKKREVKILVRSTGIDEARAEKIVEFAQGARAALKDIKIYSTFSLRRTKSLAMKLVNGWSLANAIKCVVLDRVSEEDANFLKELAQRIWG